MDRRSAAELMARLRGDARQISGRFGLRYRKLEAERAGVTGHYGICYSDGTIRIRLRHASTGRALKYSSLVNTLCHELAHLRHFDHGMRFQRLYAQLLEYARDQGIYRPGRPAPRAARTPHPGGTPSGGPAHGGPEQLPLFG